MKAKTFVLFLGLLSLLAYTVCQARIAAKLPMRVIVEADQTDVRAPSGSMINGGYDPYFSRENRIPSRAQ